MSLRTLLLNKYSLLAAIAIAAAAGYAYWHTETRVTAAQRYKTQAVEKGDVTKTVSANGTLNPVVLVNVGTQVSGTVKKLHVDFNDRVRPGQVLLELDPALYAAQVGQSRAAVRNAQASLELAQANATRNEALYAQQYVSKQDLDTSMQALKSARAQVDLATAQLARDETNLRYSVIRSPVAGVIVDRAVDVGQTVAASFQTPTLFRIAQDLTQMQIDSSFAEADVGMIRVGQPVQFTVDAFPARTFTASVRQVRLNATVQQNVVTYDVVVGVHNPELVLMPGMTAYVNVAVAQRKNVVLVPNAALRYVPPSAQQPAAPAASKGKGERAASATGTVYVLEGQAVRAVNVRVGISDNRYTEIAAGDLEVGERVIVGEATAGADQGASTFRIRMF
jgi:HlyD family secretion protein